VGNIASGSVVYDASLQNGAAVSNYQLSLSAASSQYMKIDPFTTGTDGLTFATWWRSDNSINWAPIFDFGNDASSDNIIIAKGPVNGNLVAFIYANSVGSNISTSISFNTQNAWNHVAWTLDPSGSGTWIVYINGVQAASSSKPYPRAILRSSNVLGKSNSASQAFLNGGIKDFRMYGRVLSATEVNSLFSSTQTIFIGASQCSNCLAGQYSSTNGSSSCNICPAGEYAFFAGSRKCISCDSLYSGLGCFDSGQ
jgi:hypothetical protein